jgi:hypothetical protein
MSERYLSVNYRRAIIAGDKNFEDALRICIDAELQPGKKFSEAPAERSLISDKGGHELLLNEFADVVDGVAGVICELIPGSMQPIIKRISQEKKLTTLTTANIFEIAEAAAGENTDFVQGICYFYVRGNHLLFTTVKGFRKTDVAMFFDWLLQKFKAGSVSLDAILDKAEIGTNLGRISKFRIKGSSGKGKGVALAIGQEVKKRAGAGTVAWSKAEDVVRTVLPESAFQKLIESMSDKNHLVADVQWSVAGPRGKKVQEAMQEVVNELADMDDGIIGVAAKDGIMKEGGVILEFKRLFEIAPEKTLIIDFDHATDVLVEQFLSWTKDKKLGS